MTSTSNVMWRDGAIVVQPHLVEGRPPGMGRPLRIDPAKTAVVVIDVQNFFLETPPFASMQRILEPISRFLPAARAAGMMVVHVTTLFRDDMTDAGRPGSRTRVMMESVGGLPDGRGGKTLVDGSWSAEIPKELTPHASDQIVVKKRFSGFAGTELDAVLKKTGVTCLIFAGGTTTVCVESTLRDALFLDFDPLILSDCTADMTDELHESALGRIDMFFGWMCESTALNEAMSAVAR